MIDKADAPEAHAVASRVRSEFVVTVAGIVALRLPQHRDAKLPTGAIELQATTFEILSGVEDAPFYINEPDAPVDENLRLRYRYLDIRREPCSAGWSCAAGWSTPSAPSTAPTASSRSRRRR